MLQSNEPTESIPETYLRLHQVLTIIPISRSTWYRGIQAGIYPNPIKLSQRASAWKMSDLKKSLDTAEMRSALRRTTSPE